MPVVPSDQGRGDWAELVNRHLERAGHEVRVDHRSLEAQGIDRAPEPKLGPAHTQALQEHRPTEVGREVIVLRDHRARLAQIAQELAHARAQQTTNEPSHEARGQAACTTIQDLIARRAHKLEAGREDLEAHDGRPHHFHSRAQLEGTLLDRVTIAGRDFARIAQADHTVALTPWQHQFERYVGQSIALLLAHEAGSPMRGRLIRLGTHDHERERDHAYGMRAL